MASGSLERAEHLVLAKVNHIDVAERLELINQLIDAEEVNLRDLGRCASHLCTILPQASTRWRAVGSAICSLPPGISIYVTLLIHSSTCITPFQLFGARATLVCRLASAGIPEGKGVRARCWQLLLGYLPPRRDAWKDTLAKRRQEYASFCQDFALSTEKAVRHLPRIHHNSDCHAIT